MKTFLFTVWFISPVVVIIFPCNQFTKRWKLITLDNCLCAFFVIVAILFFLLSMKVQSVYQYCSDNSDNKTFWCNLIRITGLPVSFHKISISFHYFQIDDSNKASSVPAGNLLCIVILSFLLQRFNINWFFVPVQFNDTAYWEALLFFIRTL